ncbi:MAG: uroporphyrinogen decarboxylase family protein [Desulfitobacteriaceae bacterium]|nr:uroporphyrinogen decarboxylase family protein [Desulfitobacteriaceae bacterium]MDD4753816.1 uroporphyrinogen decarboxylase family protein [Desulfitobacteriaceae bacterium]
MIKSYTPLDRMMAALNFEKPDRVPVFLNNALATSRAIGVHIRDIITNPDKFKEALVTSYRIYGYDGIRISCDVTVEAEAMGGKAAYPQDAGASLVKNPVSSKEDFFKLKKPNPKKDGRMPLMLRTTELVRKEVGDGVYIASSVMGPLNIASQMVGVTNLMLLIYDDPVYFEQLLDFASEITVEYGTEMFKAGANTITMGEAMCSVSMIGPHHYKNFVQPRHKRVIDGFNSNGVKYHTYHICGQLEPILEAVSDTGVASIDVDSPVDMIACRERLGRKTTFIGNISPAELVRSSPERITELCAHVLSGKDGLGLVLGAGCNMSPATPPENIKAMVEAAKTYGVY